MLQANPVGSREGYAKKRKNAIQEAAQMQRQQGVAPLNREDYKGTVDLGQSMVTESSPVVSSQQKQFLQSVAAREKAKAEADAAEPGFMDFLKSVAGVVPLVGPAAKGILGAFKKAFESDE